MANSGERPVLPYPEWGPSKVCNTRQPFRSVAVGPLVYASRATRLYAQAVRSAPPGKPEEDFLLAPLLQKIDAPRSNPHTPRWLKFRRQLHCASGKVGPAFLGTVGICGIARYFERRLTFTTSSPLGRERQQCVSGRITRAEDVARSDKDLAACDNRPRRAQRTALRRDSVHGLEVLQKSCSMLYCHKSSPAAAEKRRRIPS